MGKERIGGEAVALIRLHFIVEGQTEEAFVNEVLGPALATFGVFTDAQRITTGRRHGRVYRGGFVAYEHLARDLVRRMKEDAAANSWFTTMVDYYRLPSDFPGHAETPSHIPAAQRAVSLEAAFIGDVAGRLTGMEVVSRFIPYIQVHEFEALLFTDPAAFAEAFPDAPDVVGSLQSIRAQFDTPEHIDEGPATAPSKRIAAILPDYEKPISGLLIAQRIGVAAMRRECPLFDSWFTRLEALGHSD